MSSTCFDLVARGSDKTTHLNHLALAVKCDQALTDSILQLPIETTTTVIGPLADVYV